MRPLSIGSARIDTIVEVDAVPMPFAQFLPASTREAIEAERHWLAPRYADEALLAGFLKFHTYVIRHGGRTMLVDTCMGNHKQRGGHPIFHDLRTNWLTELRALGVDPQSVDYVMCTHMHADHIGWNTRLDDGRWVPTFPNARYVFAKREFELRAASWRADGASGYGSFADSVLPVVECGQAQIVGSDHEVEGLLQLEAAPGHTPGNVVIHLRSGDGHAVFCGDTIHHPLQVKYPEWSSAFCEDPVASARCRRQFVETHADTSALVLPAHFPAPTAGHIRRDGSRWRFAFVD